MGSTRGVSPLLPRVVLEIIQRKIDGPQQTRKAGRAAEVVCVVEQQDAAQSAGSAGTQDPALRRTALEQQTALRRDSWASNRRQVSMASWSHQKILATRGPYEASQGARFRSAVPPARGQRRATSW